MASNTKRPVLQLVSSQAVLTNPQEIRDVENMHSKQRCQRLPYGYQATDHFKKPVVHCAACMPEDGENHSSSQPEHPSSRFLQERADDIHIAAE
jgi:hypothetical protein